MIVPSFPFIIFALAAALIYNIVPARRWQEACLLVANLAFLGSFSHDLASYLPYLAFLLICYGQVLVLQRWKTVRALWPCVTLTLLLFVWLKRYEFVPASFLIKSPYLTIGLSYVFFRTMHMIIDAAQTDIGSVRPISYLNYTMNFLSLTAGPIQRFQDYKAQQSGTSPRPTFAVIISAVERIVVGLFKVLVVSLILLAQHRNSVAAVVSTPDAAVDLRAALVMVLLYPIYLYFNFSGYVDVVVGIGKLFRLDLPENFNRPFVAENFLTFWNRWHITLSSWLKDYVYTPLLMTLLRRVHITLLEPLFASFAFFVTFFLVGAWHGQTSEFLFFGLLQGGGVALNKLYQTLLIARLGRRGYRHLSESKLYRIASRGLTFVWFSFTLLWFWSDWRTIEHLGSTLRFGGVALGAFLAILICSLVLALYKFALDLYDRWKFDWTYVRVVLTTTQLLLIAVVSDLLSSPAPEIVYKAF